MNLFNLLRHVSMKHVRHQKARTVIAMLGITLGVATMAAIDIVNASVLRSFEDSINHITGRAVLQVTDGDSGFPESMLERVQGVPGVEYAVPVIQTNALFSDGSRRSFLILGVDALQDHQVRSYKLSDESADIPDPLLFLAKPDSLLLTRQMAAREGIGIDQKVRVQTVQGFRTLTVRGLLDPEGPARAAGGDIAVMDIYAAQLAFGKEGRIDRIDVSILPGEILDAMKERIAAALPAGYVIDTPKERGRQIELTLIRFRKSLSVVGFMALLVGMYLIYNAVSISVVHRRKETGILRALGCTQGQVLRLYLIETIVLSGLGSLAGIGLGILFAKMTVGVVAQSVTDLYLKASVSELSLSRVNLAINMSLGIFASLFAALIPASAGARITPISAIRVQPYSDSGLLLGGKIRTAAVASLLLSFAILFAYNSAGPSSFIRTPTATILSGFLLIIGVSLATPSFLRGFIVLFHRFLSPHLGAGGRLAGLNLQKNLSRNAMAAAAVFFSITMLVSSANMIHSTRSSLMEYINDVTSADILISSGHPMATGGTPNIPMPESMLSEIEKVPGVRTAYHFRKIYINYHGNRLLLESFDLARSAQYSSFNLFIEGSREDMIRLLPRQDNVVVNEGFAVNNGLKPGDTVDLPTPAGIKRFGVAAIVVAFESDSGVVWMDSTTYRKYWNDTVADMYEVIVQPGADAAAVRDALLDRFSRKRNLFVLLSREFKEEVENMLDRSFVVNNAVVFIEMIIAGFGIVITLLASVLERTREIGILRSIGMTRKQVSRIVIIESMILGACGGVLGTGAGIVMGWLSLEGFFRIDLGASLRYEIHGPSLLWAFLFAIGFSVLAGLYPARRAAKTNITEALAYE
ncbi:MAG TPA: FtsX-like permease family protein [Nitrospirota bacterium]|nr:FtsX-like permease family protein [Nitrospirota bacterium]